MAAWFRLRPTFQIGLEESCAEACGKLARLFARTGETPLRMLHGEYGELHLPADQHRLWSPHLSFHVHEWAGQPTILGRFAPRVDIWTTVWIFYLLFAFAAFFGLVLGWSQSMIGHHPWGLWIGVAALILLIGLYVVAHVGQQWSSDQMQELRAELEVLLDEAGIRREMDSKG